MLTIIMIIVGFGLIATYISSSALQGIFFSIFTVVLSVEFFILWAAYWEKFGIYRPNNVVDFTD